MASYALTDDGDFLRGPLTLPTWVGLAHRSTDAAPEVELAVEPSGNVRAPNAAQEAAIRFVTEDRELRDVVLAALLAHYQAIRPKWLPHLSSPDVMPPWTSPSELLGHVNVNEVVVHAIERDGLAYVGMLFGCSWDREHGLGVMLHGARVVKTGGADTGLLGWIAKQDLDPGLKIAPPGAKKSAPGIAKKAAPTKKRSPKSAAPPTKKR
jgi:hypothetical protein